MTDAHDTQTVEERPREPSADVAAASALAQDVIENVGTVIVGKRETVTHVVTALLGRGHVLLEDVPGVGKTMLARTMVRSFDGDFGRVQFTPDLLPTDVTGVNVFNEKTREFEFQPGPVFANVVLADEINRAPPKTQAALLEAMEEGQVTTDGETRALPEPFVVIATQNAIERDRTYELPVAEIDRFAKQVSLGYPDAAEERTILDRVVGGHPIESVEPVAEVADLHAARQAAADVTVSEPIREYITDLAAYTREHAALGVSPRGSISLLRTAQGRAILDGRDYVIPDDVKHEVPAVFSHRVRADAGGTLGGETARTVVEHALEAVSPE